MRCFATAAILLLALGMQMPSAVHAESAEEAAIRATLKTYVEAFNKADAEAVADHWADDAEYVLPTGERFQGRKAILAVFQTLFAEKQTPKIDVLKTEIRLVGKEVAIEEGTVRVVHPQGDVEDSSYLAVHVRQGKGWKLNTVRETMLTPVPPPAPNEHFEHLKELEWLVGDWREESGNGESLSRFDWSKNQKFLKGQFRIPMPDGKILEGTQVIGWDPESSVIRSWMFDSEGGFGEGLWTRNDNIWTVKFAQVLPDGRRGASTNFYKVIDGNTFEWKTIGRKVDGQFAANVGPVRVVRLLESEPQEPAKEAKAGASKIVDAKGGEAKVSKESKPKEVKVTDTKSKK